MVFTGKVSKMMPSAALLMLQITMESLATVIGVTLASRVGAPIASVWRASVTVTIGYMGRTVVPAGELLPVAHACGEIQTVAMGCLEAVKPLKGYKAKVPLRTEYSTC